ncbi:hypothetical protein GCM10009743_53820 [Kribbella swartbergensis]
MTEAAVQQLNETKRIVHQHEHRLTNRPMIRVVVDVLPSTSRGAEPPAISFDVWATERIPLPDATLRSAEATGGHQTYSGELLRAPWRRSLTTFPAASTTRWRGTLPRPSSCEGDRVEMLVDVLFRPSTGRAW